MFISDKIPSIVRVKSQTWQITSIVNKYEISSAPCQTPKSNSKPKILLTIIFYSEYPEQRYRTDDKGAAVGVPGKLKKLQKMVISSQPINAVDWNKDHAGLAIATAYDQCIRVIVTTKLNLQ